MIALFIIIYYVISSKEWFDKAQKLDEMKNKDLEIYVPNLQEIIEYERESQFVNALIQIGGNTNVIVKLFSKFTRHKINLDRSKVFRKIQYNKNPID